MRDQKPTPSWKLDTSSIGSTLWRRSPRWPSSSTPRPKFGSILTATPSGPWPTTWKRSRDWLRRPSMRWTGCTDKTSLPFQLGVSVSGLNFLITHIIGLFKTLPAEPTMTTSPTQACDTSSRPSWGTTATASSCLKNSFWNLERKFGQLGKSCWINCWRIWMRTSWMRMPAIVKMTKMGQLPWRYQFWRHF